MDHYVSAAGEKVIAFSNFIIWGCAAAAFIMIAWLFIKRAINHRKMVVAAEKALVKVIDKSERPLRSEVLRDSYLMRYIFLSRTPFKNRKTVNVRTSYYEWIKKIIYVLGDDDLSIQAYVDRVLMAHFEDNREIINDLYNEKLDRLFRDDDDDAGQ